MQFCDFLQTVSSGQFYTLPLRKKGWGIGYGMSIMALGMPKHWAWHEHGAKHKEIYFQESTVVTVSFWVHFDTLLQNATDFITKGVRLYVAKCDKSLLHIIVSILLQNATVITNCVGTLEQFLEFSWQNALYKRSDMKDLGEPSERLPVQSHQWKLQSNVWNMFKVNNNDIRAASMMSWLRFYC